MEKIKILYKSFQVILSKYLEIKNVKAFLCEDDGEYRVFCDICDKLRIERFYRNHLKSQTHTNNIRKKNLYNKI